MALPLDSDSVERVIEIALAAGQEILAVYASDFTVETKTDLSPVTEADERAEAIILPRLRDLAPEIPAVAEEAAAHGDLPKINGAPFWLVDPLDGTKQFVERRGEFTVNIALVVDAVPVLGVVHAPVLGETYVGTPQGACHYDSNAQVRPLACRVAPADGLVAAVSRSHRSAEEARYLATLPIAHEVTTGSSIKFCLVAAGQADLYPRFGPTREWDTAAGHAVVRAAGGLVSDLSGQELRYGKPQFANPDFVVRGRLR